MKIELSRTKCKDLSDFIEYNLLDNIRNDTGIDNIYWVKDMIDIKLALDAALKDVKGDEE